MKKLLILSLLILLSSCNRLIFGTSIKNLKKQVTIETGCPAQNIKVIQKIRNKGNIKITLSVCGKKMVYKKVDHKFISNNSKI